MVVAMVWVNRLTSISLEMALPPLLGFWLDSRWGTRPWLVVMGAAFGFTLAMWHLLKLAAEANRNEPPRRSGGNQAGGNQAGGNQAGRNES